MTTVRATAAMILGGLLVVGCHTGDESASANPAPSNVLDVHPAPAITPTPVYTPVATAPPMTPLLVADTTAATPAAAVETDPAPTSGKHVVKRGETMYSIARVSYGNGKQWQRIAAANPGVSPSGLKVGQTLAMP